MLRFVALVAVLVLLGTWTPGGSPARAQDDEDAEATIAALQTQVAELEGPEETETPRRTPTLSADEAEPAEADADDLPAGVPAGAVEAEVAGHLDGDKFTIRVGGGSQEVLLVGVDAPEIDEGPQGECFAEEASEQLVDFLPRGETVYLLAGGDDTDNDDRLLRFVWVADDGDVVFVNQAMLEEGYGSFQAREDNGGYDDDLRAAEGEARDDEAGLWGECGENHVEIVPPTPTPELGDGELPAPIGTQLNGDDVAVTVTSAFYTSEYGFSTPKGGYVYLVVEATIQNIDDEDHGYAGNRFSARDFDTDAEFDDAFTLTDGGLGTGTLSPGEYVSGVVVLEVQETVQRVRVKYDTAAIGGTDLYWIVE